MNQKKEIAREWPILYSAVVLVVAAIFFYQLIPVLSPVVAFVALMMLLTPFAGNWQYRMLVITASLLMAFWFLRTLGSLLAPFVLALVIAYILDPLVDKIENRRVKRPIAVALLLVPLISLATLAAIFGIPALINQAGDVIDKIPAAIDRGIAWIESTRARLQRLPLFRNQGMAGAFDSFSAERLGEYIQQQQAAIAGRVWGGVLGVGKGVTTVLTILGYLVLVPVLVIYLLLDFDNITLRALRLLPVPVRERSMPILIEYNSLLARYFRGQVLAALIVGVLTWLGLLIVGFPYSGFVGVVAGVFNLVPYLGLVVSAIPALVIAVLSGDPATALLKAGIVFAIVQVIDGTVTGPKIVGGSVGLHPVWVILALTVGSFFFGFVGLLLAMPAAVLTKLLVREGLIRYRASAVYHDAGHEAQRP
ncbi:MAG: AI-2E family transporter [Gemmatimonadota bacterium]